MDQIIIAIGGPLSVYLSQSRYPYTRYACIVGLLSQPFWLYAAWSNEQWGIFASCLFFTLAWAKGFKTFWIDEDHPGKEQLGNEKL